ncbi:histidine ammonia-lyase [Roseovarius faecimaris]|uniref:Histidine ammonia-lyase n=1 Tax=Roseovarius faecimaris TaxID=2494550 RepID=A0A6I6IKQ6_9RHOB|nr:aromatic amino acid lyase [Roseovarius faecimaris]QGX96862.1 histidine ammonia-lyase [Roseovarius faecimaris]
MDLSARVTLAQFCAALKSHAPLELPETIRQRIIDARGPVEELAASDTPVYGLNTGLGGNLAHRIPPEDIPAFQQQLVDGRSVATGPALPEITGRAMLLARLLSAAAGRSGLSLETVEHMLAVYNAGLAPVVPEFGSIGAADLTVNAVWANALLGHGQLWHKGARLPASEALAQAATSAPPLQPKDALALCNTGAFSTARAALALHAARQGLDMAKAAVLLSYAGYGANRTILREDINALRPAPGQQQAATWFRTRLEGCEDTPRRVQESLSFRLVATVTGAAEDALTRAIAIWEDEANAGADSPSVLDGGEMASTGHYHAPALALALEGVSLAMAMTAHASLQRTQKLMNPELSGLPKYLSPIGGASAGMVPMQKTCASLLAEIRRHAMPVVFDPAPVSDTVEDVAALTPLAAAKLIDQMRAFHLLAGTEAMAAAQAIDLRAPERLSPVVKTLHSAIRADVAMLQQDRPLGQDIERAAETLRHIAPGL